MDSFFVKPVGYVERSSSENIKKPSKSIPFNARKRELKEYRRVLRESESIIRILPEYEVLLDGIQRYSHVVVLYWPHLLDEKERKIQKVHPRGWKDIPKQGVFATRSPARPNPILISTVELIQREGCVLKVKGLEAFNETPVLDIKPEIDNAAKVPDWIELEES